MRIVTRVETTGAVTLAVGGTLNSAAAADLDRALDQARQLCQPIVLDLSEVSLIDRPTLKYLIDVTHNDVRLVICPDYVGQWIDRESSSQSECDG
jgi:anti-anti-sigma regulatory factor